ncbi:metallophosphoesterase [Luteimonas salinilitoris]|uniref:Metallophosphoesterase n=1 Tax=Luteimonas salinilitoris TaxID=3237697 RepID=A0ABV4HR62_9GAMM
MSKVVWLTDPHLVAPGHEPPQGVDPLPRLRAALAEAAALHADAARIVLSGDLVQLRNPEAYRLLREELERVRMPFRLLVGNHDDRAQLLDAFPETATVDGFIQSAEDLGDVQMLYLDTLAHDGKHHGELCPTRLQWLERQIAAADERPLLVFQHHPPCDIGVPALDRLRLLDNTGLARLLKARRAPTHLFCGHVHRNVSGRWAGHPFATLKSLHVQLAFDMRQPRLVYSDEPPGYGVILVDGGDIVVHHRDLPA